MPDQRISELTEKTTLADIDLMPVVDIEATPDETKKITGANVKAQVLAGHKDLTTGVHGAGFNHVALASATPHVVRTFTKGWTADKLVKGAGVDADPTEIIPGSLAATCVVVANDAKSEVKTWATVLKDAGCPVWVCDAVEHELIIEDCEDAWNESVDANVTSTADTTDKQIGAASAKLAVAAGAAAGVILATEAIPSTNLSAHEIVRLWIKCSLATAAGDLQLLLDDTANCASPLEFLDIPALTANTWTQVGLRLTNPASDTAIISIGLKYVTDLGACNIWLDDVKQIYNDEVEIQAAINALPVGGGKVVLSQGTYNITAQINLNKSHTIFQGQGIDATIIKQMAGTVATHGLVLQGSYITVQELTVDGNRANIACAATNTNRITDVTGTGADHIRLFRCKAINGCQCGIGFGEQDNVSYLWIDECESDNCQPNFFVGGSGTTKEHIWITRCKSTNCWSQHNYFVDYGCNDVHILSNYSYNPYEGHLEVSGGKNIEVKGNVFVSLSTSTTNGICILCRTQRGAIDGLVIEGNLLLVPANNDGVRGIYLLRDSGAGLTLKNVTISGNVILDPKHQGIRLQNVEGPVSIVGNIIRITTDALPWGGCGIHLEACSNVNVIGNNIKAVKGQAQICCGIDTYEAAVQNRRLVISGNVIETADVGILFSDNLREIVSNNRITDCTIGIRSEGNSNYLLIHGNSIDAYTTALDLVGANNLSADNLT